MEKLPYAHYYLVAKQLVEQNGYLNLALELLDSYLDVAGTYRQVSDKERKDVEDAKKELEEIVVSKKNRNPESRLQNLLDTQVGEQ